MPRARRDRSAGLPDRPRATPSLYPALLAASGVAEEAAAAAARAGHARLRRPRARGRRAGPGRRRRRAAGRACRSCAAAPRCSTRCRTAAGRRRCASCSASSTPAVAERVIFDLGLSRGLGYYTGAVFDVLDPALGAPIGGGGRYDDLLGRFGRAAARRRLRAGRRPAAPGARRGRRRAMTPRLTIAVPARRADERTRSTRSTRSASTPARCGPTTASCCSRTSASSRCGRPTCRPTSRPAPPTSASPARTCCVEQSERDVYELLDLGFGPCRMIVATVDGENPMDEALRRLGVMRIATKYSQDRAGLLRAHRPPGRDRRGQGLGRAGAADRAGRGHRRPDRHRHDAARERPRHPRGAVRLHRPADRQPGRPQAQGRGDRRDGGASACAPSGLTPATPRRAARADPGRRVRARRRSRRSSTPCARGGDAALPATSARFDGRRRRRCA